MRAIVAVRRTPEQMAMWAATRKQRAKLTPEQKTARAAMRKQRAKLTPEQKTARAAEQKTARVAAARKSRLTRNYGITVAEWDAMLAAQDYRCANMACRTDTPGSIKGWSTDHIDTPDGPRVRGILCNSCNTGLGKLGDDLPSLLAAAMYVAPPDARAIHVICGPIARPLELS